MSEWESRVAYFNNMIEQAGSSKCSTEEFEEKFAKYIGTDFAVLVPSGGFALDALFKSIKIKPTHKVMTSALTCRLVPTIIDHYATVKFSEVDPATLNLDLKQIKKAAVVVPIHLYGNPVKMEHIPNSFVIEDCAHALGAEYKGQKVGSFGDAAIFSLRKNLAVGTGGVVVSNDVKLIQNIRSIREMFESSPARLSNLFGKLNQMFIKSESVSDKFLLYRLYRWDRLRHAETFRTNRVTDAERSLANGQFSKIEEFLKRTEAHAQYLDKKLAGLVERQKTYFESRNIFTRYTIKLDPKLIDPLDVKLRENGFDTGTFYKREFLHNIKKFGGRVPFTKQAAMQFLPIALPPTYTKEDLDLLVRLIEENVAPGI